MTGIVYGSNIILYNHDTSTYCCFYVINIQPIKYTVLSYFYHVICDEFTRVISIDILFDR